MTKKKWSQVTVSVLGVLAMLAVPLVSQEPPKPSPDDGAKTNDGGVPLDPVKNENEVKNVLIVIKLLLEKSLQEPPLKAELKAAMQQAALDLNVLLDDKSGSRIKAGGLRGGREGQTNGEGATPAGKDVRMDPNLLKAGPCSKEFPRFADVLFHEGLHLRQDLREPPEAIKRVRKSNDAPQPVPPLTDKEIEDILKWKLDRLDQEIKAYEVDLDFKHQMVGELNAIAKRIRDGMTGDDRFGGVEWAKNLWKDCSNVDLLTMANEAAKMEKEKSDVLTGLGQLKLSVQDKIFKSMTPAMKIDVIEEMDFHDGFKKYVYGPAGMAYHIKSSREQDSLVHSDTDGLGDIETGIPHLQDTTLLTDRSGAFHILVCGVTAEKGGLGIVKTVPVKRVVIEPVKPIIETKVTFEVGEVRCCAENLPWLKRPTSVTQGPDGTCYVWDVDALALYRLPDDNGDGVPDRIDPRSLVRVPPGSGVAECPEVHWMGAQPVAEMRLVDAAGGGSPRFFFLDRDGDSFFEAVVPERKPGVHGGGEEREKDKGGEKRK